LSLIFLIVHAEHATGLKKLWITPCENFQFNSGSAGRTGFAAPADLALWNLVVELKDTSLNQFNVSFRAGTAQTSGAWGNNTLANNGSYNIHLIPILLTGNNGVLDIGNRVSFNGSPVAIGAGAGPSISDDLTHSFSAGTYLLQVEFSGQGGQRNTIDDLSFTAAIPEPSTLMLTGLLALAGVIGLRRRKA
jgi:hypothetical protein